MRIALVVLSPVALFTALMSLTLFMLFWRMAAEPGYMLQDSDYILPVLGVFCVLAGVGGTLGLNFYAFRKHQDIVWRMWVANIAGVILYTPVFILTIVMSL